MADSVNPRFWESKTLAELNSAEWESLCDGCGKCCLHKLEDEDSGELFFTRVACRYLDLNHCRCKNYPQRLSLVPECLDIQAAGSEVFEWLPETCAYRLLFQGNPLPSWHPLNTGNNSAMEAAGISVKDRVIAESQVDLDHLDEYVIHWVD